MSDWFGINFPFSGGVQNVFSKQIGVRLIKNDILQLFYTNPEERVYRSDYGIGIRRYLFEQLDDVAADTLEDNIKRQINKYEPRVIIDQLTLTQDRDNSTLNILAVFSLVQSPDEVFEINLNLPIFEG